MPSPCRIEMMCTQFGCFCCLRRCTKTLRLFEFQWCNLFVSTYFVYTHIPNTKEKDASSIMFLAYFSSLSLHSLKLGRRPIFFVIWYIHILCEPLNALHIQMSFKSRKRWNKTHTHILWNGGKNLGIIISFSVSLV